MATYTSYTPKTGYGGYYTAWSDYFVNQTFDDSLSDLTAKQILAQGGAWNPDLSWDWGVRGAREGRDYWMHNGKEK